MAKGDGGCLNGALIGCAVLLVLALGAGAFGYYKVVRPVQDRVARVGEIGEESARLSQRLDELNATYAYQAPEDPAEVVLEEGDVERYIAVRSAVAQELSEVLETGQGGEPLADSEEARPESEVVGLSDVREMFSTMFGSFEAMAERRLELQRAAVEALEAQRMSPRELRILLHLVEWRFLGRDDAAFFGLPADERALALELIAELREDRRTLAVAERFGAEIDGRSAQELRTQIERTRTQIALLRDRAANDRDLHPRTRALLEERRDTLEEFEAEGVDVLATLTDQEVEVPSDEVKAGG